MLKKAISVLLSVMMIISALSVTAISASAAEDTISYVVAGTANLCDETWSFTEESGNIMTQKADGTYELVFSPTEALGTVQLKVAKLTNGKVASDEDYYGDATGNNITFKVTNAGDVTVNFDPTTLKVTVTGDNVAMITDFKVDAIRAVGAGDGNWLNDVNWDPADDSNLMTEVSDKVYEITYKDIEEFDNYLVKFAANGSWTDNWGGTFTASGEVTDADYNGGNIVVEVPYELANVTLRLDLTGFDYATKTGAKFTVTVTDATEVSTTEPVTEAPTTEPVTEPVTESSTDKISYVVAGTANLCDETWSFTEESGNIMEKKADGTYELVFSPTEALGTVQIKVAKLTNGAVASDEDYYGDATGNNITFKVTKAGDVTVNFDPATATITVTGDNVEMVTDFKVDSMRAVGAGDGNWLNDANWDPADDSNLMTEVSDKVYEITYKDVEEFDNYLVKFAANGSWTDNWGGTYVASGEVTDADYNGGNIVVEVPYETADVTLRLDLTGFDYATKTGAKFTVTVKDTTPSTKVSVFGDINLDLTAGDNNVYTGVTELEKGTYKFKINNDGTTYCNGAKFTDSTTNTAYSTKWTSFSTLNASGGKYTFKYNAVKNTLTIDYLAPSLASIVGDINLELQATKDANVFSSAIKLDAGNYDFRVMNQGVQYCCKYTYADFTVGSKYYSKYTSASTLKASGGTYTFTYDISENKLTISFLPAGAEVSVTGNFTLALAKTANANVYSSTVDLKAGNYQIKMNNFGKLCGVGAVVKDVTPGLTFNEKWSKYTTFVATGGTYTFTYNIATNRLVVTVDKGDIPVKVTGGINLTLNKADTNVFTRTTKLAKGTYNFKLSVDGTSFCNGTTIRNATTGTRYNSKYTSATTFVAVGGTYTFTYNAVTNILTVEYAK